MEINWNNNKKQQLNTKKFLFVQLCIVKFNNEFF